MERVEAARKAAREALKKAKRVGDKNNKMVKRLPGAPGEPDHTPLKTPDQEIERQLGELKKALGILD